MISELVAVAIILCACILGILFGLYNVYKILQCDITGGTNADQIDEKTADSMIKISKYIADGAHAFLMQEYKVMAAFIVLFSILIFCTVEEHFPQMWTMCAFILGSVTSIICGFIGMKIAVVTNVRTTKRAFFDIGTAFVMAFRGGAVMGFCLVSLALMMLTLLILLYKFFYLASQSSADYLKLFECIAGYGLGGSSIALFGRVGGGIYTKAADVGADLAGKVIEDLEEDSPKNPGTIADNVGDNVGDIAGMGSDLFGSLAESTCAALVVSGTSAALCAEPGALYYPLVISALGIPVALITCLFATTFMRVDEPEKVENVLKYQLIISTILMTPTVYFASHYMLPATFSFIGVEKAVTPMGAFLCVVFGLWSGFTIGYVTEYYTSNAYKPVQDVARACETGAATNIIYGLALGYSSTLVPILALATTIYISFTFASMYGVALAALGMLSTLCVALTIDGYGPISDNAGGIAEMCEVEGARERTDALDAAGNTTAAIGKGFAIGSACLVALALFGAFITRTQLKVVDILQPLEFAGLVVGAMLPYAFSAMTMSAVGEAAKEMVEEIRDQFKDPDIMNGIKVPDYDRCVKISTSASLSKMIAPGVLVMGTPLLVGFLFGPKGVSGVLAGAIVSGVQMAISSSNSGGAWDNAKKYIETTGIEVDKVLQKKHTEAHKAAVQGDTVGDPLKDTSGPSLNILIKLMAILSLVFGGFFARTGYLANLIGAV